MTEATGELIDYQSAFEQSCLISEGLSQINAELEAKIETLLTEQQKLEGELQSINRNHNRKLSQLREQMDIERQQLIDQIRVDFAKDLQRKEEEITKLRGQLERIFVQTDDAISSDHQLQATQEKLNEVEQKYIQLSEAYNHINQENEKEKKLRIDWEQKYQLLEKRKDALKSVSDNAKREDAQKIQALEHKNKELLEQLAQLQAVQPNQQNHESEQQIELLQRENQVLNEKIESLTNQKQAEAVNHSDSEKISAILQQTQNDLQTANQDNTKLQQRIQQLEQQIKQTQVVQPLEQKAHDNDDDKTRRIHELEQQNESFRQEILQRTEHHEKVIAELQRKINEYESLYSSTSQSYLSKFQSVSASFEQLHNQVETVHSSLLQYRTLAEQHVHLQQQFKLLSSQMTLKEQELQAQKELLNEERKNLEVAKDITCDLRKHVLQLTEAQTHTTNELNQVNAAYQKLQLEHIQQKKHFEKEKASVVFEMLQQQMNSSDVDEDDHSFDDGVLLSPGNRSIVNTPRGDEKKTLTKVKKKLIEELWKQACETLEVPPHYDNGHHTPSSNNSHNVNKYGDRRTHV